MKTISLLLLGASIVICGYLPSSLLYGTAVVLVFLVEYHRAEKKFGFH